MLRNYIVIAFRNLIRYPLNSFIKIIGLTVGVAGCLVIFLLFRFETSFDTFHEDGNRICRVYSKFSGAYEDNNIGVPEALPTTVQDEFTGLEASVHFQTSSAKVHTDAGGQKKRLKHQEDIALVPPDYFNVFKFYEWIEGSPKVLEQPFRVVLTQEKARLYFGTTEPAKVIGQRIFYNDSLEVTVAGLLKTVTQRTDLFFNDFISYSTIEKSWLKDNFPSSNDWTSTNSASQFFIKLAPGTDLKKIEDQLPLLNKKYADQNKESTWKVAYYIQPLSDLHFNTSMGIFDNSRSTANLSTLQTLVIVAVLLLLIAVINFVNLETARSVRRAKEIGLRKVLGSTRGSLIRHYLIESVVLTTAAIVFTVPLAILSLLSFQEFLPTGLALEWAEPFTWLFLFSTIIIVSLLAGVYPAFVLSSYQPVVALKNQVVNSGLSRSASLRKVLTVFQFSFSQILIVGTLVVGWQINYMLNKELGFTQDAIVTLNTPWWEGDTKVEALQNELNKIAEVTLVSRNQTPPASTGYSTRMYTYKNDTTEIPVNVYSRSGDINYLKLFDIRLIAGRNVQPVENSNEILVNNAFVKRVGRTPSEMIDQTIIASGKNYLIVGVMEDFHFRSLHHSIEPLSFRYRIDGIGLALKLSTNGKEISNLDEVLKKINASWKEIYPDDDFDYKLFNESIQSFYESERKISKLTNTATALTIFISCLGLLGLASFTTTQRTKEIGIRKVLGATVNNIIILLSREFLLLVGIAFFIAAPIAWYVSDQWLNDFAYRISIGWQIFVLAGSASLLIAFITVSFRALKAAITNPVDSLRYE